jgi:hypothetical protein
MRGLATTLLISGLLLCGEAFAGDSGSWFARYQPDVVVSDPYIEMHTGPGKGYPIFYVAGQGDEVKILKRRTDWFKIRLQRGTHRIREGWVHVDQMRHTLDLDGNPIEFPNYGMDDFSKRRWVAGIGGGNVDGANTINGFLGFHLNPYISLQMDAAQILADYSDGWMVSGGIYMHPFPDWRISPFVTIGTGYIHMSPQTTIVQAEDQGDEIVNAGAGANVYISDRFILRMQYKRYTVYTSRDDNEEFNEWTAGFSLFF